MARKCVLIIPESEILWLEKTTTWTERVNYELKLSSHGVLNFAICVGCNSDFDNIKASL